MKKFRIFKSSVQGEFARERESLSVHFCTDALLLTPELSIEKLKTDHAFYPTNPLLAEPLYQAGYIERYGKGTGEIFHLTTEAGLKEPEIKLDEGFKVVIWRPLTVTEPITDHVTDHVTGQVTGQATGEVEEVIRRVLLVFTDEMKSAEIQSALQLKHREYFRDNYLNPALDQGFVEMVFQEKPNNPNQKYRLTTEGIELKDRLLIPQPTMKPVEKGIANVVSGEATLHDTLHDTIHDTLHDTLHVATEIYIEIAELAHRLVLVIQGEMSRVQLMEILELKNRSHFVNSYLDPALLEGLIEMTLPETPKSKNQKYRLTSKGNELKKKLEQKP